MSAPRLRDETLAWLAVRDRLERRSRRTVYGLLVRIFGGRGRTAAREAVTSLRVRNVSRLGIEPPRPELGNLVPKPASPHMVRYSLAVDEVAHRLTEDERRELRANGAVPDWFLPAVYKASKRR